MDLDLIATIRRTLGAKPTEELRREYEARDPGAWSPEAFEAMRQLLAERGEGHPPPPPALPPGGFAYSGLAGAALAAGAVGAGLGCVLIVVWSVAALASGQVGYALLVGPLGFLMQLAMVVVFLRVKDLRP